MTKHRIFASLLAMGFVSLAALSQTSQQNQPIQPSFFGMHVHELRDASPQVSFGSFRFWGTGTLWQEIETSQGTFDWTHFDKWVSFMADDPHFVGNEAMFVLGPGTPPWASSEPDDRDCDFYFPDKIAGQCYPAKDLAKDGSGTDQIWKDWVTAVATHAAASRIHVKYWEIWDEFDHDPTTQARYWAWAGTPQQMLRMAEDTRCIITGRGQVQGVACASKPIDASAIILSPSFGSTDNALFLRRAKEYFSQPGAAAASEQIAYHNYEFRPELTTFHTNLIKSVLPKIDRAKPLISTEGSWHGDCELPNLDVQASFVARQYLMLNTNHVQAHYWYNWFEGRDHGTFAFGTLWNPDGKGACTSHQAGLTPAGVAYQQMYDWMVGATVLPCTQDHAVYQCKFSRSANYSAVAVWDASQTCDSTGCSTRSWTVPPGMSWYRDLAGNRTQVEGKTVQIGLKPILLESRDR